MISMPGRWLSGEGSRFMPWNKIYCRKWVCQNSFGLITLPTMFRMADLVIPRRFMKNWHAIVLATGLGCFISHSSLFAQGSTHTDLKIDWSKTAFESKSTPTLQVVVNPMLLRGSKMYCGSFAALKNVGGGVCPLCTLAALSKAGRCWIRTTHERRDLVRVKIHRSGAGRFRESDGGHSVVMNFSTMPAWLWKTDKPVYYPEDPN